jgi:riboflavin kinase/FMN adenylyltransferase
MPSITAAKPFVSATIDALPPDLTGASVAIGNFDGMHRGHQAVLEAAARAAEATGRPAVLLTFEPHPRDVFRPDTPVFRLTPPAAKARVAAALGLDGMVVVPFDAAVAGLPAERFATEILADRLGVSAVACGFNFHFGKARGGTTDVLRALGADLGFSVSVAEPFVSEDGEPVSSSRIRDLLADGEIPAAAGLLGYRWFFDAQVVHGDKRGRTIGYPTANVRLPAPVRLAHGIYAVMADLDGRRLPGVASFGRRPMFDNGAPVFETYLFDFAEDIYGRSLRITPVAWLRPELRFDSLEALIAQMDRDSAESRALLSTLQPVSPLDRALLVG